MMYFLPLDIWKNKRGIKYGTPVSYLTIGYHAGQDFFSKPLGTVPVIAPCDGALTVYPFSKSAGWWGVYQFTHEGQVYSLKIMHMYRAMKAGAYTEGAILGYCGGTGLAVTSKYGTSYIGESDAEQNSDRAVPHLHVELHKGEYKNDTNNVKALANLRIIDPVNTFENWIKKQAQQKNNTMTFYKEKGKSAVYLKGADGTYYPIITGRHFTMLFGEWSNNAIQEVDSINPRSDSYFGLFRANPKGEYDIA